MTWAGCADILALGLPVGAVLGVVSPTIALLARTPAVATHHPAATAPAPSPIPADPPGPPEHT